MSSRSIYYSQFTAAFMVEDSVSSSCIHRILMESTPFLFLVVTFIEITSLHALHDLNEDVSVSLGV